jgi:serine protease Do
MKIDLRKLLTMIVVLAIGIYIGFSFLAPDAERVVVYENNRNQDSGKYVQASIFKNNRESSALAQFNQAFVNIAHKVKPSVVTITAEKVIENRLSEQDELFRKFFGFPAPEGERRRTTLGSGVVVSNKGYILTNHHVIENGEEINVILADGAEYEAEIIGSDAKTDIAVIKIEAADLSPISMGDSDQLQVGEWVAAIGSPLSKNLAHSVTAGIVSAKSRNIQIREETYASFIQTDAAINPGNSGGALVNIYGELIGINTAIATGGGMSRGNIGIGFAVPVNMAKKVMKDLIETGQVQRAWLGVVIGAVTDPIARAMDIETRMGALVNEVVKDSPAEEAGIEVGDVIIEYNGKKVENPQHLISMVTTSEIGENAELKVVRKGEEKSITVELAKRPADDELTSAEGGPDGGEQLLGMKCRDITPELAQKLDIEVDEEGVVVVGLERGSEAAQKLRLGDIIKRIGNQDVKNIEDLKSGYEEVKDKQYILLLVKRGQHTQFITLENE